MEMGQSSKLLETTDGLVLTVNDFYWSKYKNTRILQIEESHWQRVGYKWHQNVVDPKLVCVTEATTHTHTDI